jgi:all-trans-8'-apo-beta-carotenal 15,15'-oxygenase
MTRHLNRRDLIVRLSALAAGALVTPEIARAAGQLAVGEALGVDWGLAFADRDGDLAPAPMKLLSGACPEGLSGALYRNGPGKFRRPGGSATHWFDGDGLVRAFRVENGQASLSARFVDTAKRRTDTAAGAVVTPGFGTAARAGAKVGDNDDTNAANISMLALRGKNGPGALWALWEGGSPVAIDPTSLSTLGLKTLRSDLAHMPFLAHPRVEPGGEVWNLGVVGDKALVWRLGGDGALISAEMVDLPCASYVHDFTATARHLILVLQPLLLKQNSTLPYIDGFAWKPTQPTRILVLDKADLGDRKIYELPAMFAFHFGDAWADPDGTIHFDACVSDDPTFATRNARQVLNGDWTPLPPPRLSLITLTTDRQARIERTDTVAEFPRTDPLHAGWPRAYTVHATGGKADGPLFHGLATHNWKTGASDTFDFGGAHLVEEAVFVPRPGSAEELDGWLLAPSVNLAAKATELHVFDAGRVAAGPLASWRAEVALPVSLHGAWVGA